jgi:hypothetical protein
MPNSNINNNILDGGELLNHGSFKIAFSTYWQKVEGRLKQAQITLALILIVIFGSIIARDFSNLTVNSDEVFTLIFSLPIPFAFLLFIFQFKKFRNRDFKEKITPIGRLWRVLTIAILLGLFSAIVFAIIILASLFFMYELTDGFDGESMGMLIVYMPILLLSGFQTFYLGYSILYLIQCKNLKKQYA